MQMLRLMWTLILVSFSLASEEQQFPPVKVALLNTPGALESGVTTLPYNKFIAAISEELGDNVYFEFHPFERAKSQIKVNQIDCMFPVVSEREHLEYPSTTSDAVNTVSIHIFSIDRTYKSLSELSGTTVIYFREYGFVYRNLAEKEGITFVPIGDQKRAFNILNSGRASAYIGYLPDMRVLMPAEEFNLLRYAQSHPLNTIGDSFECYSSDKNKAFVRSINKTLSTFKSTGKLQRILGGYYNM